MCYISFLIDGTGYKSIAFFQKQIVAVTIITLVFQYIPRSLYRQLKYMWIYFLLEFLGSFHFGLISQMNNIQNPKLLNGDLITGFIIICGMCHNRLLWMYLEDLLFNDLNQFTMMNYITSYTSWIIGPPTIYLLQIYFLNMDLALSIFRNMNSKY